MAGPHVLQSQVVRVRDADGKPLTSAMARAEQDDGAIRLAEIDDPAILLDYYFGRCQRLVMIELPNQSPPLMMEGALETWWISGERVWQIYIDRPLVTLGPVDSEQPEPAAGRR